MPRGLMIKRRRGLSAVSYRVRPEEPGLSSLFPGTLALRTQTPPSQTPPSQTPPSQTPPSQTPPSQTPLVPLWTPSRPAPVQFGNPEVVHALHSPTRPVSRDHERRFSHVTPECWATHAALPEAESGLAPQITSTRTDPGAKRKTPVRRLQVRDDVTTSPVLGLKIKEAPPERRAPVRGAGLVCQLCREAFPEPLALAQHRCSRIVRVEYRCDCGKAFGCSANLASHRRWHRPHSDSDSAEDAAHECARCGKRFKRLASLRKHEARHEEAAPINLSHRAPGSGNVPGLPGHRAPGSGNASGLPGHRAPGSGNAPGLPGHRAPGSGNASGLPGHRAPGSGNAPGLPGHRAAAST